MRRLGIVSSLALLVLAFLLMHLTVFVFVAASIALRGIDYPEALRRVTSDPLPLGTAQLAALGAVITLGMSFFEPGLSTREGLGVIAVRARITMLAAALGLALQLPMVELTTVLARAIPTLAHPPEVDAAIEALTRMNTPLRAFSVPLTFVVIAPVTEELLFRGLILRGLRTRYGPTRAILASAILFAAFHLDPQTLVFGTLVGLLLGVIAERAGSTLPSIALHAGFNALPVLFPAELVEIPGFNAAAHADVPLALVLSSTVAALVLLGILVRVLAIERTRSDRTQLS